MLPLAALTHDPWADKGGGGHFFLVLRNRRLCGMEALYGRVQCVRDGPDKLTRPACWREDGGGQYGRYHRLILGSATCQRLR
jgi:hypothetical protein